MTRTLVLGVGNTLLTDEGVGVHVVNHLQQYYSDLSGVTFMDGGTLSFTLAESIAAADWLIVVDAAELKAPPGTVRVFEDLAMDRFLGVGRRSVHEVGLLDLLDIARLTDTLPARRALVGIQPEQFGWGDWPSAPVAEAIPTAAHCVLELIRRWAE